MATASFHRFPDLPAELRLQIWELVACTAAQPRIHFMPVDEYTPEEFGRRLKSGGFDLYGSGQPHDVEIMPRSERSWVKDNESAYLIDAGMWTACKESASVLMKKRRKSQTTEFATFRDGDNDWVFDVDIHRDLFCFQLKNDANWNSGWDELPFWRTSIRLRNGADMIAVEYDSSWAVGVKPGMTADALNAMQCEPGPRGFFLSTIASWREDSHEEDSVICLIDRSIHRRWRKPDNPAWGSFDRKYRAKGRTFGVVKSLDDVVEETLTSEMNAFIFLEAIGSVEGYWTWEKYDTRGISRWYYIDPESDIPVLATIVEEDVRFLENE